MEFWDQENTARLSAVELGWILPESWVFNFADIAAAMNYYHPNGLEA